LKDELELAISLLMPAGAVVQCCYFVYTADARSVAYMYQYVISDLSKTVNFRAAAHVYIGQKCCVVAISRAAQ